WSLAPASPVWNLPAALRLRGDLDVEALERTLSRIVDRHETLRTTFSTGPDGTLLQRVGARPGPVLSVEAAPDGAPLLARVRDEFRQPFDLRAGPMLRARLLRVGPRDHVLAVTTHHVAADGWSLGIIAAELQALYGRGAPPLPPLAVTYADF